MDAFIAGLPRSVKDRHLCELEDYARSFSA